MKFKKVFSVIMAVCVALCSVCVPVNAKSNNSKNQQITLRFSWWGSDSRHQATLEAIDKYMAANPNITIEAEYGGFDGYRDKVTTQMVGGTEPDIMQIDQPWLSDLSIMGDFFADLYQYGDHIDISGFDQKFLDDFCVIDKKLIGLPTGINGLNFIVNTKLAEESGIDLSGQWDWDRFYEEGKKVNEKNSENYFLNQNAGAAAYFVGRIYLYQLTGTPLINDDDYTIAITKDELKQCFEYMDLLYKNKVIIPAEESMVFGGSPQDNPKWNNDQLCAWFNWSSTTGLVSFADHAEALAYPILKDAKQSSYIVRPATIFSISKNSDNIEEAAKFLNYLFNEDEGILALKTVRSIPAVDKARSLLEEHDLLDLLAAKSIALVMENVGDRENILSTNTEISDIFSACIEKIAFGQGDSIDKLVDEAFELWEDTLKNLKASRS